MEEKYSFETFFFFNGLLMKKCLIPQIMLLIFFFDKLRKELFFEAHRVSNPISTEETFFMIMT